MWRARTRGAALMLREIRWAAVSAGQETLGDNLLHYCWRQYCPWLLPQLVGEAARALAGYPSESLMTEAFDD